MKRILKSYFIFLGVYVFLLQLLKMMAFKSPSFKATLAEGNPYGAEPDIHLYALVLLVLCVFGFYFTHEQTLRNFWLAMKYSLLVFLFPFIVFLLFAATSTPSNCTEMCGMGAVFLFNMGVVVFGLAFCLHILCLLIYKYLVVPKYWKLLFAVIFLSFLFLSFFNF